MSEDSSYRHAQRVPVFLLSYAVGVMFLVLSWMLRQEIVLQWVFPIVAVLSLILAAAFHHLTVEDSGDRLLVYFGPLPLFRRSIRHAEIVSVESGRTTLLDGWLGMEHLGQRLCGTATTKWYPQGRYRRC